LLRVEPERVYRFYRGGSLIGLLRGVDEADDYFPEDWVGSTTPAGNPGRDEPEAGLSRVADGRLVRDVLAADPDYWLGAAHVARFGASPGLLVKLLDPAERLPVHAHPSREFASTQLGSQFGKTEAWLVLETRGDQAEIWVGLRDEIEPVEYRRWIDEQDTEALLGSLNHVAVRSGDLMYVPAGVPHAIGGGALIAELQEPTDFLLLCEWKGFPIDPNDTHLGLGWDAAFEALDLSPHVPALGLPETAKQFFWIDELLEPAGRFAVLLVLEGEGRIEDEAASPGNAFVVPAGTNELRTSGDLRVLRCLAPLPS
jgi:mannose-6-phosphate isomerase